MIYSIWSSVFLVICTITDLKERKIYSGYCFMNVVLVLIFHFFIPDVSWISVIMGMGLGGMFFIISIVSKEALGKGDAVLIFTLGSISGIKVSFEILTWAFTICSAVSVIGLLVKKRKLNSCMPFAPFLLAGSIITMLLQEGNF